MDPESNKRPDLSLLNVPGYNGVKLVVDVSITCPHPLRGPGLSRAQADKPLRRANQIFDDKTRKYEEIARRNRIEFLPLIVESTGRLHPKLIEFLNLALREKSRGDNLYLGKLKRFWFSRISCTIQNALMESLLNRVSKINGRITSSQAGDYTMSDSTIDRFGHICAWNF